MSTKTGQPHGGDRPDSRWSHVVLRTGGSRLVGEVFAGRGCGTGVLPVSVSTKIPGPGGPLWRPSLPECVSWRWACQMSSCSGLMPALVTRRWWCMWNVRRTGIRIVRAAGWVKQPPVVRLTDFAGVRASGGGGLAHASPSCPNRVCARGSWTTSDARIAAPRGSVTHRARRWLTTQVGEYRRAVSVGAAGFSRNDC